MDPKDGEDNVPLDTKIKVTFDESMDKDTLDEASLILFNLDGLDDPRVGNAKASDKSVTYTLDEQLEAGTRYEAELDFDIQDKDGNYLDCFDSNDVDSSCRWQFDTTGSSTASIELSPASGPFGITVTVRGTGFDPNSDVIISFGIFQVDSSRTDNNGDFVAEFAVPISFPGPHTVAATTDLINSDSATFTVTSSPVNVPIIGLNDTSGPIGTPVNIIGINFEPNSEVTITFAGTPVATTPSPVPTNSSGGFSADFTVPLTSTTGLKTVTATDAASNSDSTIYEVTPIILGTNQQLSTNLNYVMPIENPSNQSKASRMY